MCNFSDHFIRGIDETARGLVPYEGEICKEESSYRFSFRYALNRFERHTRFLNKKAEQSLAISKAAKIAGKSNEQSIHSPYIFKASLDLGRCGVIHYYHYFLVHESKGSKVYGR